MQFDKQTNRFRIPLGKLILQFLLIIIALMEVKWFYLPSNTHSILVRYNWDGKNFGIVVLIVVFSLLQLLLFKNYRRPFMFKNHILLIWIIWVLSFFYTAIIYGQDITYTFNQFCYFFVYLLYFSAIWHFETCDDYSFFETLFVLCSTIFSILLDIQVFTWQRTGKFFLTVLSFLDTQFVTRYGFVRILYPAPLLLFCTVLAFGRLLQNQKRNLFITILDVTCVISGTVYVFTSGTRALMVVQIIAFAVMLLCKKGGTHLGRDMLVFAAVFAALYYASENSILSRLAFSTQSHSFEYRIGAIGYFLKQGLLNPAVGLGFLTDSVPQYADLLHGPYRTYYISDVGIAGFAGQMGIVAAITYLIIIIKICKECVYCKRATGYFDPVMIGIASYVVVTAITLSLQINHSIIAMVLSMIIIQYRSDKIALSTEDSIRE